MVSFVTDSLDADEVTNADQLKVPSSPVDSEAAPSINDLDFTSPLFDSLPDFDTLKDYWICRSPIGERLGECLLEVEEVMDAETKDYEVAVGGSESLSLGGVKVEGSEVSHNRDFDGVMKGELEAGERAVDENEGLEDVKSEEKSTIEVSGSLSPTIEANLRKVSLDGPVDVSVAADNEIIAKVEVEEKCDEADSEDSSEAESESESESSSSEDSSSEAASSSEDDEEEQEEDGFVKKKAEVAGQLEEGEIMDEDVEQMVAWSDDEEEVVKGPIRSKNEITDLPHVPPIEVSLNSSHQTFPVGVILSIVGKQVIVEGVEKHNPLNEGSILWITESREPLGLVDDIFGPVKNPYYSIRYNNEDDVPSDIRVGSPISFVPEFVNHVLNDPSLYKKGYDASNENDEELSEELEFSDDEKEAEYRKMMKMSKRGSNEEGVGKKKKDKRKNRNQERIWNNQRSSPQINANDGDLLAVNSYQYPSAPETSHNQTNQFSEGGPPFPLSGMTGPFQNILQHNSFNGVWPNGMPIQQQQQQQQQQQPMFFPNAFPTNGMPWMQQNNLVRNPFMPMSMPQGMPFPQQFGNQMIPGNLGFPGPQQFFMGGSSNSLPFPGFFGQNNFNQGNGQIMATSMPSASITSIPSPERSSFVQQQPSNIPANSDNNNQKFPDMPTGRGRNPSSHWRGRSGGRGGRFNRGNGRGRGHHQGN